MKRKQDHQASKAAKRMASHADEHSKYEEQMMMVWKTRNILREECDKETLRLIKSQNGETPTSEQTNLNDCAERIVFGAFKPCPNCNKSSKYFKETSNGFVCTGGIANIPCEYVTEKRERCACKISEELKAKSPFLNSYSYTPLDRIQLNKDESCFIPEKLKHRCIHRESIVKQKPLGNIRVATIGKLEENMSNIRKKIENLGGIFHEQISKYVDLCVGRLDKLNKKLKEEIDNLGLPTVSEECLSAFTGDNFDETITKYGVSNCTAEKVAKIKNTRKGFYSTNIISPSGLAITDPHSGLENDYSVIKDPNCNIYSAVIETSPGGWLKLQALQHNKLHNYCLFTMESAIDYSHVIRSRIKCMYSKVEAMIAFDELYYENTGITCFKDTQIKRKIQKGYPVGTSYISDNDKEAIQLDNLISSSSSAKISPNIEKLLKIIFNVKLLSAYLLDYQVDVEKIKLKALTTDRVEKAVQLLHQIDSVSSKMSSKNIQRKNKIIKLKEKFFNLIYKDLHKIDGFRYCDDEYNLREVWSNMDDVMDIAVCYDLIENTKRVGKDLLYKLYQSMKIELEPLLRSSDEFNMIFEYGSKVCKKKRDQFYNLSIEEVYKVQNHKSHKKYEKYCTMDNRMLLWLGNRVINYSRILTKGLQPMAKRDFRDNVGFPHGKGIYFSDMFWQAALDCGLSITNSTGLLMLCEVALGRITNKQSDLSKARRTADSFKFKGKVGPDPDGDVTIENGVVVPLGDIVGDFDWPDGNKYVIYNPDQVKIRYLVLVKSEFVDASQG